MFDKLKPDYIFDGVFDITAEFLKSRGIVLLLCDLDNTLAPYGGKPPSRELINWKETLNAAGITIFIVSNTKKPRAELFARQFGAGYIKHARKPRTDNILLAIRACKATPRTAALVGDQLFTDTLGANNSGCTSILVRPISLNNPLYLLRNLAEKAILRLANKKAPLPK
ncbi:MAG: YqeG family HAD IIIA-type phosphatase [Oscillospiraceae bacterium]|jgi:HAD superfamily phosphatase (TIGR01668 family)|nr:YqeG family HAD IIIA-type phosphatase [Oscillospiraceae bacterium]